MEASLNPLRGNGAVLMLGIPYAGIQYFKSQGIWYDSQGNPHADIWVEE